MDPLPSPRGTSRDPPARTLRRRRLGPQQDVFIVQRMVARGVDVIWHRCATFEGIYEAAALGPGVALRGGNGSGAN